MQENEIVMLVLGVSVFIFTLKNRNTIKKVPAYSVLMLAFYCFFTAILATVLEGFFLEDFLNYVEHISYATSAIMIALWCWHIPHVKEKQK